MTHATVTFAGLPAARGPLTCGQRIVAESLAMRSADADYSYTIDRVVPLPSGLDVDGVCDAVHALVCRHESLRTRFVDDEQLLDGDGDLPVLLCDSVERARTELTGEPFDVTTEWGVRIAVVSRGDRPRAVVLCLSHLAVDAWAANLVVDDLRGLLRTPEAQRSRAGTAWQPLRQAESERTPDGLARQAEALDYLHRVLGAAEPARAEADPDAWSLGELRSTEMDVAARATAARCRMTAAVVYLAATAVMLGPGRHVVKTITHNRSTAAEAACVAPFAMDLFVPIEVAGESFDAILDATWESYREAARHSRYDPAAVRPLLDAIAAERGTRPDLSVLVNDVRASTRPPAATAPTTFRWGEPFRLPGLTRYLSVSDDGAAVVLTLLANGVALPREEIPIALQGFEQLLLDAAAGDVAVSRR